MARLVADMVSVRSKTLVLRRNNGARAVLLTVRSPTDQGRVDGDTAGGLQRAKKDGISGASCVFSLVGSIYTYNRPFFTLLGLAIIVEPVHRPYLLPPSPPPNIVSLPPT